MDATLVIGIMGGGDLPPLDPGRAAANRDYDANLARFKRPEDMAGQPNRDKSGEPGDPRTR